MKNLLFLCISLAVVIFTVLVLNLGPGIHGLIYDYTYDACNYYKDLHKYREEKNLNDLKLLVPDVKDEDDRKEYLDLLKEHTNVCNRHQAATGLEYTAFNINMVFGGICALLGLLYYLSLANSINKVIGIIGLATGVIGFVLTFVYTIYIGIIFTQEVEGKSFSSISSMYLGAIPKVKSDGTFLKWDDGKKSYVCIFYNGDKKDSLYVKYSDYGKKYLNYYKKHYFYVDEKDYEYKHCKADQSFYYELANGSTESPNNFWERCKMIDENKIKFSYNDKKLEFNEGNSNGECDKLRLDDNRYPNQSNKKKNIYDHWVATLIFSILIFICDIGLAIFGFLIFNQPSS